MKVLMVTPYLANSYGGTSKVVKSISSSLGKLDILIDVLTTNASDRENLSITKNKWVQENNYQVGYFPSWYRSDLIFSWPLLTWLNKNIKNYDIIHTHTLFAPLISVTHKLCHSHKLPYIMTPHGMLDPWALAYKAWKKRFYYHYFERKALNCANAIHVLSQSETEQVINLGYHQTMIIPNGIDLDKFEKLPSADLFHRQFPKLRFKKIILFLGRIDPKKGLDILALAFARIHAKFPDAHLVLAGPDSINFTPTVKSYFSEENCLNAVTFTGMLSGKLKYSALAAANLYVSPSYSEGFSMSVLEGMASALPCVITTGCNFPEAATNNAAHVVDIDSHEIAEALFRCFENPIASKAMGTRARQFIFDNYTWDKSAQKLVLEYERIIKCNVF